MGKHDAFDTLFRRHGLLVYNNSLANTVHKLKMVTPSLRHLSEFGHRLVGKEIAQLLSDRCENVRAPPRAAVGAEAQVCKMGRGLKQLAIEELGGGFDLEDNGDGRTPAYVATVANATLYLRMPPSAVRAGFLSLAFERSWKHKAIAQISCMADGCTCNDHLFYAHTSKKYTFTQRSPPTWTTISGTSCVVRIRTLHEGRLALKGATLSAPKKGNRSVKINSLYSLVKGHVELP